MKKRILSCLMALALCLTLLPTAALAADGSGTEGESPAVCTCTAAVPRGAWMKPAPSGAEDYNSCAYEEARRSCGGAGDEPVEEPTEGPPGSRTLRVD